MPKNDPTVNLSGFKAGLNNRKSDVKLKRTELRTADNIDIDTDGMLSRRAGFTKVNDGEAHSIWSTPAYDECYFVRQNSLYQFNPDFSALELRNDLGFDKPMSFTHVNGEVFYSDGDDQGRIVGGVALPWGPVIPNSIPTPVKTLGTLTPGTYLFVVAFQDSDGRESGTSLTGTITLHDGGGIDFTSLPVGPAGTSKVRLYLTDADSTDLYLAATVDNGVPSVTVATLGKSIPVRNQLFDEMPPGHIVRYHAGRIYVADGNVLWYSEPLAYHLCDLKKNFILYPQRITMVEPVDDGLYVASDKTYFLSGTDPSKMSQKDVAEYQVVEGTSVMMDGSLLGFEDPVQGDVPIWLGAKGICAGLVGGAMINLTEDRVSMDLKGGRGAGLFREEDGVAQFIGLTPRGEASGFAASDTAVAEVIRNGVSI